jgi:HTH-type transcriptional regulator / antitoxin HigA
MRLVTVSKPIRTAAEHRAALKEIERLMDAPARTPAADRLEVLSILIADYEERNVPIDPPHPIEAIKFRLDQMGLTRGDLERVLGSRARVSEVLNRIRPLSIKMIRRLKRMLRISADVLVPAYHLRRSTAPGARRRNVRA